jgi:hypothetical protein
MPFLVGIIKAKFLAAGWFCQEFGANDKFGIWCK